MADLALTPETQVSEVAARHPEALRMLEALGIDYCCGGKRPLAEAAAEANVPLQTVISVLETAVAQAASAGGGERNWSQAPLDDLMKHIVETHHTYMHGEMPRLEKMAALVAHVHGPNHGDVLAPLAETYGRLKAELEAHLEKEEQVVFPAISHLATGDRTADALDALRELEEEHEVAGGVLAAMRAITSDYAVPQDACATYEALYDGIQAMERDIHQHIHLENNILIPRVRELAGACRHA